MGTQKLVFEIGSCFSQSCRLETAIALELLILGDSSRGVSTDTLVRQFGLTTDKVKTIRQIGKALPAMPSIENDSLEQIGRELADLADDNGAWRENFERHAPTLVDQKVVEIESGLEQLVETTVNMKGFLIAENLLSNLEESYKKLALASTSKWQPAHSERLRHSSQTYIYLDEEFNQTKTMFKPWAKGLKKDDKLQIRQQFEKDIRIGEVRIQQCKAELVTRILARLLDNQNKRSLAEHSKIVAKQVEQLRALKESVNSSIEPLKDTVTVTQLIESTTDILTDDRSLHDLITGAFKANRCDRHDVARAFRKGIRYKGARISPSELADMEINQAKRLLFKFADTFFNGAAETVLRIDFTEESVQLLFAKKLRTVYEKANPYFRFMDLAGVQRIRETYLHCHPEVRLLVDKYRSGTPRYSNPATDTSFHLPERHVLVITSNVLGPGHARRIYASARYIRDRMIGEGTFAPLHPFDQLMARPLAIAKRPDDRHDSEQLFNLALESGNINERTARRCTRWQRWTRRFDFVFKPKSFRGVIEMVTTSVAYRKKAGSRNSSNRLLVVYPTIGWKS